MNHIANYDDIRELDNGFNNHVLEIVYDVIQSGHSLSKNEVLELVHSTTLINVCSIDLTNQKEITDDIIEIMAKNPTFSSIHKLYLGNTNITKKSIEIIHNSNVLGSVISGGAGISGKYCVPCSSVDVYVSTDITPTHMELTKFNFHIDYRNSCWLPVDHGLKTTEVSPWYPCDYDDLVCCDDIPVCSHC